MSHNTTGKAQIDKRDATIRARLEAATRNQEDKAHAAILAAVANSRTDSVAEAGSSMPVALTEGFQTALMVGAGFAIVGAILAFLLIDSIETEADIDGELVPVTT